MMSDGLERFLELAPGTELGVSDWHRVTQEGIDAFARLTQDPDPYHMDPEWARRMSPFGTTISYGFLTLALLTHFAHSVLGAHGFASDGDTQMLNFGFNRIRFPEPVPVQSDIRGRFTFAGARERPSGGLEVTLNVTVEIRGNDRPALVAEWLFVAVAARGNASLA